MPPPLPSDPILEVILHIILLFLSEMAREATEEEGNKVTHHMIARYQTANKKSTQVWNFFLVLSTSEFIIP